MRDCTRYTINAALHVVTCILMDSIETASVYAPRGSCRAIERDKILETVKVIAQLREDWMQPVLPRADSITSAPDMARRNG